MVGVKTFLMMQVLLTAAAEVERRRTSVSSQDPKVSWLLWSSETVDLYQKSRW